MKKLLIAALSIYAIYYIYTNHSPFQTKITDPYFVEIRISVNNTNVELVGFGKMFSHADCLARSAKVWSNAFKHTGKLNITNLECSKTIPSRREKLFDNKAISASYLALDRGNNRERDGRFIFYGVPSSHVIKECNKIIASAKRNYKGNVYCVKGKIG